MQLTPQQNDAILHDGGNLQLIACAGFGQDGSRGAAYEADYAFGRWWHGVCGAGVRRWG